MPLDPICKKNIPDNTQYISDYGGKSYYFCSPECKQKFGLLDKRELDLLVIRRNNSNRKLIN